VEGAEGCESGGKSLGLAVEMRRQVLDEVDLVHVAALDRRLHCFHAFRICAFAPRPVPLTDAEVPF
jgi:hypothetical protein